MKFFLVGLAIMALNVYGDSSCQAQSNTGNANVPKQTCSVKETIMFKCGNTLSRQKIPGKQCTKVVRIRNVCNPPWVKCNPGSQGCLPSGKCVEGTPGCPKAAKPDDDSSSPAGNDSNARSGDGGSCPAPNGNGNGNGNSDTNGSGNGGNGNSCPAPGSGSGSPSNSCPAPGGSGSGGSQPRSGDNVKGTDASSPSGNNSPSGNSPSGGCSPRSGDDVKGQDSNAPSGNSPSSGACSPKNSDSVKGQDANAPSGNNNSPRSGDNTSPSDSQAPAPEVLPAATDSPSGNSPSNGCTPKNNDNVKGQDSNAPSGNSPSGNSPSGSCSPRSSDDVKGQDSNAPSGNSPSGGCSPRNNDNVKGQDSSAPSGNSPSGRCSPKNNDDVKGQDSSSPSNGTSPKNDDVSPRSGDKCPACGGKGCPKCGGNDQVSPKSDDVSPKSDDTPKKDDVSPRSGDNCPACGGKGCPKCGGNDQVSPKSDDSPKTSPKTDDVSPRSIDDLPKNGTAPNCPACGGQGCKKCGGNNQVSPKADEAPKDWPKKDETSPRSGDDTPKDDLPKKDEVSPRSSDSAPNNSTVPDRCTTCKGSECAGCPGYKKPDQPIQTPTPTDDLSPKDTAPTPTPAPEQPKCAGPKNTTIPEAAPKTDDVSPRSGDAPAPEAPKNCSTPVAPAPVAPTDDLSPKDAAPHPTPDQPKETPKADCAKNGTHTDRCATCKCDECIGCPGYSAPSPKDCAKTDTPIPQPTDVPQEMPKDALPPVNNGTTPDRCKTCEGDACLGCPGYPVPPPKEMPKDQPPAPAPCDSPKESPKQEDTPVNNGTTPDRCATCKGDECAGCPGYPIPAPPKDMTPAPLPVPEGPKQPVDEDELPPALCGPKGPMPLPEQPKDIPQGPAPVPKTCGPKGPAPMPFPEQPKGIPQGPAPVPFQPKEIPQGPAPIPVAEQPKEMPMPGPMPKTCGPKGMPIPEVPQEMPTPQGPMPVPEKPQEVPKQEEEAPEQPKSAPKYPEEQLPVTNQPGCSPRTKLFITKRVIRVCKRLGGCSPIAIKKICKDIEREAATCHAGPKRVRRMVAICVLKALKGEPCFPARPKRMIPKEEAPVLESPKVIEPPKMPEEGELKPNETTCDAPLPVPGTPPVFVPVMKSCKKPEEDDDDDDDVPMPPTDLPSLPGNDSSPACPTPAPESAPAPAPIEVPKCPGVPAPVRNIVQTEVQGQCKDAGIPAPEQEQIAKKVMKEAQQSCTQQKNCSAQNLQTSIRREVRADVESQILKGCAVPPKVCQPIVERSVQTVCQKCNADVRNRLRLQLLELIKKKCQKCSEKEVADLCQKEAPKVMGVASDEVKSQNFGDAGALCAEKIAACCRKRGKCLPATEFKARRQLLSKIREKCQKCSREEVAKLIDQNVDDIVNNCEKDDKKDDKKGDNREALADGEVERFCAAQKCNAETRSRVRDAAKAALKDLKCKSDKCTPGEIRQVVKPKLEEAFKQSKNDKNKPSEPKFIIDREINRSCASKKCDPRKVEECRLKALQGVKKECSAKQCVDADLERIVRPICEAVLGNGASGGDDKDIDSKIDEELKLAATQEGITEGPDCNFAQIKSDIKTRAQGKKGGSLRQQIKVLVRQALRKCKKDTRDTKKNGKDDQKDQDTNMKGPGKFNPDPKSSEMENQKKAKPVGKKLW